LEVLIPLIIARYAGLRGQTIVNALRLLKGLIFFGKRDLSFGINLPERS